MLTTLIVFILYCRYFIGHIRYTYPFGFCWYSMRMISGNGSLRLVLYLLEKKYQDLNGSNKPDMVKHT